VGLAGIMGGQRTAGERRKPSMSSSSCLFLAYAIGAAVAVGGLVTDASQRYERGVDPTLQQRAMDRL